MGCPTQDTVSGKYFWRVQAVNGAFEQGAWSQGRKFESRGCGYSCAHGEPGTGAMLMSKRSDELIEELYARLGAATWRECWRRLDPEVGIREPVSLPYGGAPALLLVGPVGRSAASRRDPCLTPGKRKLPQEDGGSPW